MIACVRQAATVQTRRGQQLRGRNRKLVPISPRPMPYFFCFVCGGQLSVSGRVKVGMSRKFEHAGRFPRSHHRLEEPTRGTENPQAAEHVV